MATYTYKSKQGSMSFARKLQKLIDRGHISRAHYLFAHHEAKYGKSTWNPAFGILRSGGARCPYTNEPIGA